MGNKGVSPLLFDTEDIKLGGGFSYRFDGWAVHAMGGHAFKAKRTVPPDDALILPGEYTADGPIFMIGFSIPR